MERRNTPRIRFPEFQSQWESRILLELLSESKTRNFDSTYSRDDVLSVSGELGVVNQIGHLGRSYAGESILNYHVVETGDVVYTKSPLKANPYGIIKVNKGPSGIVSTLYAVYKVNAETCDGRFLDYYFSLDDHTNKYLRPLVRKGAKNDMKINNADVLVDRIVVPSVYEQEKIAAFLSAVDEKIEQLARKKELLLNFKKGVMQQIFSQRIRFKDEHGKDFPDWETKELKEISDRVKRKNKANEISLVLTNSATKGVVSQSDYFDKDIANPNNLSGYYVVDKDDFVYNPRISTSAPVGPIKRNKLAKGVMSPLYTIFRLRRVNLEFFEYFFETNIWHDYMRSIANFGARHDRMNITMEGFFEMPVLVPSRVEQDRIATFLRALDEKIDGVEQQMEKTKTFKKALLQQMFV